MKTEESNKMIAEFMGNMHDGNVIHEELYDVSWDWLMPVAKKISDIKHWSINATLEWLSEDQDRDGLYSIEEVYEAVVEFIMWHNKNKK